MNVLTTRVVMRERSLAEVFDLAFRFVIVRGGRKYFALWLLVTAPLMSVCVVLRRTGCEWGLVWAIAVVGFVIAQIPFTLSASRLLLADDLALGGLLRGSLRKLPAQLLMHAAALAMLGVGALVVVPVPFVIARFLYLPEISLLEGSGLIRAYERGTRITRHRLASALGASALLCVLAAAFVLGAEATGLALQVDLLSLPAPTDTLQTGGSWFALGGFFAAVPFIATARFLVYIDGRTRREAWDVQLRFTELAQDPRGAA